MKIIKKYKWEIIFSMGLVLIYFFTRLHNILSLPIFTDEAIYIRWSQIAKDDANWRFISLTDGKQPLFVWLTMIVMRFIEDPLLSGRLVSVAAGFFTMVGLFLLSFELFKNKIIGFTASLLYILYPFALVYDRMALYESLTNMFYIWALYFGVLLARNIRLDTSLLLGFVIGGGVLTKSTGFITLYLLPTTLLLFNWTNKIWKKQLLRWMLYVLLVVIVANGFYLILRLSPFFYLIAEKNTIFVYPFSKWILHPFTYLIGNMRGLFDWILDYMSLPIFLMVFFAFLIPFKNKKLKRFPLLTVLLFCIFIIDLIVFFALRASFDSFSKLFPVIIANIVGFMVVLGFAQNIIFYKEKLFLFVSFAAPFFALALFGNNLYPRYVLFMSLVLLPLLSYVLVAFYSSRNKILSYFLGVIVVGTFFYKSFYVIYDFSNAQIAPPDLGQYINDWPAGGGIKETVAFFEREAKDKKIFIATEGTFGLMPYALEIYLNKNPNISIEGLWPIKDNPPVKLIEKSKLMPSYLVFYQPCSACKNKNEAPFNWPVTEINKFQKGIGDRYMYLYKINP